MDTCCKENRTTIKKTVNEAGTWIQEQCSVCKKNHYRFEPKPFAFGMRPTR